jgi:septum site-determining protein MinD
MVCSRHSSPGRACQRIAASAADGDQGGPHSVNAKAIVVTSGKGGVGKTTTTANVGAALAKLGEKVCVIDTDVGLRNLDVVMGLEGRVVFDLIDVFEGRCKLRQALIRDKRVDSLYLLAASQTKDKSALSEGRMRDTVRMLLEDEGFDRVVIDSPAGIESGFQTAASAATGALVVVNPEVSSVRDADRIIGLLESREIAEVRLIVNRLRPAMVKRGDMLEVDDVLEILGVKLIGIVPEDEAILVSTNVGSPASLVEGGAKASASQAFRNIARRIKGEDVAYLQFDERRGFLAGLRKLFGGA